jgi:hypothetical protein
VPGGAPRRGAVRAWRAATPRTRPCSSPQGWSARTCRGDPNAAGVSGAAAAPALDSSGSR